MTTIIPENGRPDGFPNFGTAASALAVFREVFSPWLRASPGLKRMAVGGAFVIPVEDKARGYRAIQRFLPDVRLDPDNSSDFSYSINRGRGSNTVASLHINRLSRWSVAKLSGIQIQVFGDASALPRVIESANPLSACRVELDINTGIENNAVFGSDVCVPLFGELIELASEILNRGDVP